jgi:hypothetical protein
MHAPRSLLTFFALLALSINTASAIQNIFLGATSPTGDLDYSIAWFTDSNGCQDGTVQGPGFLGPFPTFCAGTWTILGHTGITFTGCNSGDHYPNGVSDGGAPALTCEFLEPETFQTCPGDAVNPGFLETLMRCS